MNEDRVEAVADAIASLGHEGIVAFDETEPEYGFLTEASSRFDDGSVALLGIYAGTQDYMLNGDAQQFWGALSSTVSGFEELSSAEQVLAAIREFLQADVNARLRDQKLDRIDRMAEAGFGDWFLGEYPDVEPESVWERIADALNMEQSKKTVVMGMKVYDIFSLINNEGYLDLPLTIALPCDVQVKRIASTSGITQQNSDQEVINAWRAVAEQVNAELEEPVSMLRIDSIVWQAGQIVSEEREDSASSQDALVSHFVDIGVEQSAARSLAEELTDNLS